MSKIICALFVTVSLSLLGGCAGDTIQFEDAPDYANYSPGYTGYSIG